MNLNVEDISSVEKKVTVSLGKEEIAKQYEKMLNNVKKDASIKGFRKGKAPKNLIKSVYDFKIREQVMSELIESSFKKALDEKGLKPLATSDLDVKHFNENEGLTYTVTVEIFPEFEVADYSGLALKKKKEPEIGEAEIEKVLKSLQEQHATFKSAADDKEVASGDMVVLSYTGYFSDGTLMKDTPKDNFSVLVGANNLIPGFEENLIGLKKGGEKEFHVTFPADYFAKEYAGATVKFHVKATEIKERELPTVDDHFALDIGCHSLDELKALIKADLNKKMLDENKAQLYGQIDMKLLEQNVIQAPKHLVEKQLDYVVHSMMQDFKAHRTDTNLPKDKQAKMEEDLRERWRDNAVNMVKKELIFEKIIQKEKLEPDPEKLEELYEMIAQSAHKSVQEVKSHYKGEAVHHLEEEVLTQMVYEKIIEKAEITQEA